MICVSIARGRHKHVMAEHRHLVEKGAELVEIRLDYIRRQVNLKRLFRDRPSPIIATCRREQDHGKWSGTEETRQMLLRAAIAEGVEYVDLEEDVADKIPRYGKTKRIVSMHNFRETPEDLEAIHARLAAMDADIVKMATMANDPHDNVRMIRLLKNTDVPTIGICMGEIGMPTRILAGKFGAPFTFATFHHERTLAPGQLSFQQMVHEFRYQNIGPETEVYGVVADPIGHSLSPVVHNSAFARKQLDKVYLPFRVPREYLRSFFADCRELGVRGLSVTIPHKEDVIRLLSKVDVAADGIGAVNTVIFNDEGETWGYNTDQRAALGSLLSIAGLKGQKEPFKEKVALVLGAGGAAKAICYGLKQKGAKVTIASRTFTRSQALADRFECKAVQWEDRHSQQPDVLINATPVGMHPNVDETPFDKDALRRTMIVFDTVYNPENTLLVKDATSKDCRVVTGVDMFVRQAALQFKLFTNEEAPDDQMRDQVKRATGAAQY